MKRMIMLKSPRAELKSFMTAPYTERILSQDKKVLLYNSRLHLFVGKLKTQWSGPFMVQTVFPHGTVKISDPMNDQVFKVNG